MLIGLCITLHHGAKKFELFALKEVGEKNKNEDWDNAGTNINLPQLDANISYDGKNKQENSSTNKKQASAQTEWDSTAVSPQKLKEIIDKERIDINNLPLEFSNAIKQYYNNQPMTSHQSEKSEIYCCKNHITKSKNIRANANYIKIYKAKFDIDIGENDEKEYIYYTHIRYSIEF